MTLHSTLGNTLMSLLPKTETDLLSFQRSHEKCCRDFESRLAVLSLEELVNIPLELLTVGAGGGVAAVATGGNCKFQFLGKKKSVKC